MRNKSNHCCDSDVWCDRSNVVTAVIGVMFVVTLTVLFVFIARQQMQTNVIHSLTATDATAATTARWPTNTISCTSALNCLMSFADFRSLLANESEIMALKLVNS